MARSQQPEHASSDTTNVDPDPVEQGRLEQPPPSTGGEGGPIPVDNQPGHHPAKEQDKPDLDAFAAKLGTRATPTKAATSNASASKTSDSKAAKTSDSKAAPEAAPVWPESAPAADDLGPLAEPDQGPEPRLVGLVLLPLRETVKRLEQLDRSLTERLSDRVRSVREDRGPRGR